LTILGLRLAGFLSLAKRLGWFWILFGGWGFEWIIIIGSAEDASRIERSISDCIEGLGRDLIGNEELRGNPPRVVGVTEADREELLMLRIS
jgi:hypothetical protein